MSASESLQFLQRLLSATLDATSRQVPGGSRGGVHNPTLSDTRSHTLRQDLQLPPAFSLPADESVSRAIELAYERDFSHIP